MNIKFLEIDGKIYAIKGRVTGYHRQISPIKYGIAGLQ
jgi:hypothetical protein